MKSWILGCCEILSSKLSLLPFQAASLPILRKALSRTENHFLAPEWRENFLSGNVATLTKCAWWHWQRIIFTQHLKCVFDVSDVSYESHMESTWPYDTQCITHDLILDRRRLWVHSIYIYETKRRALMNVTISSAIRLSLTINRCLPIKCDHSNKSQHYQILCWELEWRSINSSKYDSELASYLADHCTVFCNI